RGLLQLLQLKSGGANPQSLLADVRPSIDLTDFWAFQLIGAPILNNESVAAAGTTSDLNILNPEIWIVYALSATLQLTTAGDVAMCSIGLQGQTGGFMPFAQSAPFTATATQQRNVASAQFNDPLILTGSFDIRARVDQLDIAAGTRVLSCQALAARLVPDQI
ncbi:MAG: hypothetical protein GY769_23620, partial [bacterium]|nr:hypothetical protein [bacterium]